MFATLSRLIDITTLIDFLLFRFILKLTQTVPSPFDGLNSTNRRRKRSMHDDRTRFDRWRTCLKSNNQFISIMQSHSCVDNTAMRAVVDKSHKQ